jgi:hypothetical protein
LVALLSCAALGCSSLGGSAVRTGPLHMAPHLGPVMVFAAGQPMSGTELGVVEVHASQVEATIETLMPLFVDKVAQLGGNAAVIDVRANFEMVAHPYAETYVYPCGFRSTCIGTHMYATNDEVMVVTMRGRAFSVPTTAPPAAPAPPAGGGPSP